MRLDGLRLRAGALLGAGSLAVHELRYLVGYGGEAGRMLAAHGHSYLALAATLAVLLLLVALAGFLARVARGGDRQTPADRTRRLAPAAAAALFAIYSVQELLEGLVAPGHPGGFAGVYGNGGWTAVLFAAVIGLVIALLLRGADAVLARVAARRRGALPRPVRCPPARPAFRAAVATRLGISRNLAGRAPPLSFA
jgi:hypothetical protein